ncbi:MAG: alpha-ketoglutarate-dependent dioxygenase AlkB [Pseudomonadales bacterium]|nr:alpha-ketoglutarate-dependent dioxygenase AlkB [Pseudomonadales bacterium]
MDNLVQHGGSGAEPEDIELVDGHLRLWRNWMTPAEASTLFDVLRDELAWEQSTVTIYGKRHRIPRLNAWYGDPGAGYRYSGTLFEPLPWTPSLSEVRARVEETTGHEFNGVLANCYRDGADGVGWHSDDEPELGKNPVIASVSLGSERRFSMKHKRRKDVSRCDLVLPSGSLLLMTGPTQHHWVHQLPKTVRPVAERINLTFRLVVAGADR